MTDHESVRSIVDTYEKYGWVLRRILSSPDLPDRSWGSAFGDIPWRPSDIDAAWFSRPPKPGGVAWELRYLGEPAFALLEQIDEDHPDFEDTLAGVEQRLKESLTGKKHSLTSE